MKNRIRIIAVVMALLLVGAIAPLVTRSASPPIASQNSLGAQEAQAQQVQSKPAEPHSPWNLGDVFVTSGASYKVYDNNGVFKESITDGLGGPLTGCAFDEDDDLYTTNFGNTKVVKFDDVHPHPVLQTIDTALMSPGAHSESIVFASNGDFYVGHPDGNEDIHRYNAAGVFQQQYDVAVDPRGTDWIDLAVDQMTMFYTGEGRNVKRYNMATSTQLADFAALPGFGNAYALRLLPPGDGTGGLLVADASNVKRLNGVGAVVQTYDAAGEDTWFALNLDPNGTSFWSADLGSGNFYRFNIATGAIEVGPILAPLSSSGGICVKGELQAAQPTPTSTTVPTNTPTNTPSGPTATPCDVCKLYFADTNISCNSDGTVGWNAVVRNNHQQCTVNTPYKVQLQRRVGFGGRFMTVAQFNGMGSFPPEDTFIQGELCHELDDTDLVFYRIYIALDSPTRRCNADHLSPFIDACLRPDPCPPSGRAYRDVPADSAFYPSVNVLSSMGAVSGYGDGSYRPANTTTRAQLAKVVTLAFGMAAAPESSARFSDVPSTHPFFGYIAAAHSLGLINGYSDGTFRPQENVTRGQAAKIVALAAVETMGWELVSPAQASFTDVAVGSTYYTYVETALANGALSGYADGTFRVGESATRGQIAQIVNGAASVQTARLPNGWEGQQK